MDHSSTSEIYLGMMSGTSLDGIDVVAVDFRDHPPRLLGHYHGEMPPQLRHQLYQIALDQPLPVSQLGAVTTELAEQYASCTNTLCQRLKLPVAHIQALGCHGQTVFHQPSGEHPFSLQLNNPSLIAAKTGITTVADFRSKDLALHGQGAPLVPAFHQALFADSQQTTIVLNIGGIANISVLQPGQPTLGYDTGPGNMLMDSWIQHHLAQPFDQDGQWAASGQTLPHLLTQLLATPYLALPPPKSTGRELFHLDWLRQYLTGQESAADVQATLLAFTAISITHEVDRYACGRLLVCGGGAHNRALMEQLQQQLPNWKVQSTDQVGISADMMEAMAFAWLARQTMLHRPGNLTDVTGASRPAILGGIFLADPL
ncbi:anhydro-N-acetylmuramic acid kinase [Celerinatantimonas sp. YJH-8]|uniref:anhydro-N-acetylmuramic acid kinase n=1 Tax=Celerinatantimonas sp. YJH-8 TaxID=3228714 RepID=UPI0038C52886